MPQAEKRSKAVLPASNLVEKGIKGRVRKVFKNRESGKEDR